MLSDAQKYKILRLLCYPYGTLDPASLDYSKIVSDKLSNLSSPAQVEVEELLSWIEETETQLDAAIASAGVKRIDEIEFFDGSGSQAQVLTREKSRYVDDLATLLGIPNMCRLRGGRMGRICV